MPFLPGSAMPPSQPEVLDSRQALTGAGEEAEPLASPPCEGSPAHGLPAPARPFAKAAAALAFVGLCFLGAVLALGDPFRRLGLGDLSGLRGQRPSSSTEAEVRSPIDGLIFKGEVDNLHIVAGYTEFAHVNCFDHRGATSAGLSQVNVVVKTADQCAMQCNKYEHCHGFVIFYRYFPFKCWLRANIAKDISEKLHLRPALLQDKGLCQQYKGGDASQDFCFERFELKLSLHRVIGFVTTVPGTDKSVVFCFAQDLYHFATYERLSSVETTAFSGTISFKGKCIGVSEPEDGAIIKLNECGCQDCWVSWEAQQPEGYWKIFHIRDFPSESVTSFRLAGTDKCLDVHDHADWRKTAGLDSTMNLCRRIPQLVSTSPRNYLQLWTCSINERSRKDQKWIVHQSPDKISFQLQWLTDPGLALDVPKGQNLVGSNIQIYKFADVAEEQVQADDAKEPEPEVRKASKAPQSEEERLERLLQRARAEGLSAFGSEAAISALRAEEGHVGKALIRMRRQCKEAPTASAMADGSGGACTAHTGGGWGGYAEKKEETRHPSDGSPTLKALLRRSVMSSSRPVP
eukprot:s6116_g4.t1